jgi:glutathione S-transferase
MGCGGSKSAEPKQTAASKNGETGGADKVLLAEQENEKPLGPVVVYGTTASMNCMGAVMLAAETRCGKLEETNPGKGTTAPEFLAMNPFHGVPTLKDDKIVLAESNCILRYMGEKYATHLYPADDKKRQAFINWAMDRFSSSLYTDVSKTIYVCFGYNASPPEDQAAASKTCSENLTTYADVFLKEKFIGGDRLSIADYKVAPFFYIFAHPMLKEKLSFDVPDRIKQFNKDFAEMCKASKELDHLKGHLDRVYGSKPEMLTGTSVEVKLETADQLKVKNVASSKSAIRILGVPLSTNCAGPIMLSKHANIGEMEVCKPGESRTSEHLALNPFGGVPTLKDGDFFMAESSAILRYLAQAYAQDLYPQDAQKRAKVDWAIDRFTFGMYNDCVSTIYVAMGFVPPPESDTELMAAGKKASDNLREFAEFFLNDPESKFIGGNELSIADFKVAPFFLAYSHDLLKDKYKVTLPDRIAKFNEDFANACKASEVLRKADGAAIMEWLDDKMKAPEQEGEAPAQVESAEQEDLQEAMAAECQKKVTMPEPEVETKSVSAGCGCCA